MARTEDEPAAPSQHFEYKNRPNRDVYASVILAVASLLFFVGGVYSLCHWDQKFYQYDFYKSDHCAASGRKLLESSAEDPDVPFNASYFISWLGPWVAMSVVFSALMGALMVHLFLTNAQLMIKVTVGLSLSVMAAYAVILLVVELWGAAIVAVLLLALYAYLFYRWSDRFPLMARLLSITSAGLKQNSRIAAVPILIPAVIFIISMPMAFFASAAAFNGRPVPESNVTILPDGTCQDKDGLPAACCAWQPDGWVPPYLFLAVLLWCWLLFLGDQVKVFVISGTIAQWYFSPVGTSTSGNLLRSTRHALGASFGSLCLSSAILTIVNMLRQMARNARNRSGNLVFLLVSCIADCLYGLLQFLTKFATIRMAIAGESFFTAASSVVGLLSRNFLDTVAVWWLPPLFLNMFVFTASLAWGTAAGLVNYFAALPSQKEQGGAASSALVLALISFVLCLIVLSFVSGLMLQIVDTVYICYALELEAHTCVKPEVHEVYNSIPKTTPVVPGDVVQNPDGNLAYAQPVYTAPETQEDDSSAPLLTRTAPTPGPESRV